MKTAAINLCRRWARRLTPAKRWHYYSYTFQDARVTASVYIGYPKKNAVFMGRIEWAKEQAGVYSGATLLSCCYLGRMTDTEFRRLK